MLVSLHFLFDQHNCWTTSIHRCMIPVIQTLDEVATCRKRARSVRLRVKAMKNGK